MSSSNNYESEVHGVESVEAAQREAEELLTPLHHDLLEFPAYTGGTLTIVNKWSLGELADPVVSLQAEAVADDHAFYDTTIHGRSYRVKKSAFAEALRLPSDSQTFIRSVLNPGRHTTFTYPGTVQDVRRGGFQTAFDPNLGPLPDDATMNKLGVKHKEALAGSYRTMLEAESDVRSLGDALFLNFPEQPNAVLVSMDQTSSSKLVETYDRRYLAYLERAKRLFEKTVRQTGLDPFVRFHDNGDGLDAALRLPDSFDYLDEEALAAHINELVLPTLEDFLKQHTALAGLSLFARMKPEMRLSVGLGYVELEASGDTRGPENWALANLHKQKQIATITGTAAIRPFIQSNESD